MAHAFAAEIGISRSLRSIVTEHSVQPFDVHRVQNIFHGLQPVRRRYCKTDFMPNVFFDEQIPARQQRCGFGSQVSEDQSAKLFGKIVPELNSLLEPARLTVSSKGCSKQRPV